MAATALFDAAATAKESFAVSAPFPRIFTPSRGLVQTPAAISDSIRHRDGRIELARVHSRLDAAEVNFIVVDREQGYGSRASAAAGAAASGRPRSP